MENELLGKLGEYPSSFHTFEYLQSMWNKRKKIILDKVKSKREISGYTGAREDERELNFLSYLSFAIGEYEEAKQYNNKVLEKNEHNINALVSKARYHLHDSEFGDTEKVCTKLEVLKDDRVEMLYARAEHAFVCTRLGSKFYKDANTLLSEVLRECKEKDIQPCVSKYDICLWKFGIALILKRQLNIVNMHSENLDHKDSETERCNRALELLRDIVRDDGDVLTTCQARAYVLIGEIINLMNFKTQTKHINKDIVQSICPDGNFTQKKEFCYETALKLHGNDVFVLERSGKYFRLCGQVDKSIELCERALQIRETSIGHHYLALALKKKLEFSTEPAKSHHRHVRNLMNEKTYKSEETNCSATLDSGICSLDPQESRKESLPTADKELGVRVEATAEKTYKSTETIYSRTLNSGMYSLDSQESHTESLPTAGRGHDARDEKNADTKSHSKSPIDELTGAIQQTHLTNASESSDLRRGVPSFHPKQPKPKEPFAREANQHCKAATDPGSQTQSLDGVCTNVDEDHPTQPGGFHHDWKDRGNRHTYRVVQRRQRENNHHGGADKGYNDNYRGDGRRQRGAYRQGQEGRGRRGRGNHYRDRYTRGNHAKGKSVAFKDSHRERVESQLIKSPKKPKPLPSEQIANIIYHLDKSIDLGDNIDALYDKGLVFRAAGQSRNALEVFKTMFRNSACSLINLSNAYEQSAHCLRNLCETMNDENEKESANLDIKVYLLKAIEIQCTIIVRQPSLKKCWSAIPTYKSLLEQKPHPLSDRKELGKLHQMLQDYNEAIACFKQVLEHESDDRGRAKAHIDIAQTCVNAGHYDEALVHLDMFQCLPECGIPVDDSLYFDAHIEGGLLAYSKGEIEMARLRLKKALHYKRPDEESADAHDNVGVHDQHDTNQSDCYDVLVICDPESDTTAKQIQQLLGSLGLETTLNDDNAAPGLPITKGLSKVIERSTHCIIVLGENNNSMSRIKLDASMVTGEHKTRCYGHIVVVKETDIISVDKMFNGFTAIVFEDVQAYTEAHKPWIKKLLWTLASGSEYVHT